MILVKIILTKMNAITDRLAQIYITVAEVVNKLMRNLSPPSSSIQ